MSKIVQFDWRRHWKRKVEPHLRNPRVQACLDFGMRLLDRGWKRGDAPWRLGAVGPGRIVKGKLSWYRPLNRCHHISLFAMAIGVLNYPELNWRMLSGDLHSAPVGFGADGAACIVMDILLFDVMTAEQSIAFSNMTVGVGSSAQWETVFRAMEETVVPIIRATARGSLRSESFRDVNRGRSVVRS